MIHTPPGRYPSPGRIFRRDRSFFDCDTPALRAAAGRVVAGAADDVARAVRLFYWIRDGWRYDPFSITLDPADYVASRVLARDRGYCIAKAVLMCVAAWSASRARSASRTLRTT